MNRSDKAGYMVIINQEEQYPVWPADVDIPKGRKVGI
jgi:uncharacterized protein YbdZ (MbtH family)